MWGFNTNIDEVWVPDPVLFLNAEIIYCNQQKNQKKKENKKRKQLLKAMKANESNLYDSQFQITNETLNDDTLNEESQQVDPDDSDIDERLNFNSILGDVKNDNQIQQNTEKQKQQSSTNIGKSLFSSQGLQSLKKKGALNVQKSISFIETKNNYDCIVKALHLENRIQRFEELKKIFQNNGGINDQVQAQNKNAEQTISASKSLLNDKVLFDLKISLVQKPKDRLLITITDQQDLQTFLRQIKEVMEQNYQIFNGLTGFKVKTLEIDYSAGKGDQRAKVISNIQSTDRITSFYKLGKQTIENEMKKDNMPANNIKSDMPEQNSLQPGFNINESMNNTIDLKATFLQKFTDRSTAYLSKKSIKNEKSDQVNYNLKIDINSQAWQEEIVKKFLRKNDRCFVRMESQDLWLDIDLLIEAQPRKFQSNFQMKVDMDMSGKQLKKVIQKMSISIWNQIAAENNLLDEQKHNQNDIFLQNLIQYQNWFLLKQLNETFTMNDEQQIFNSMIEQVHQLLKGDHLYVLTDIKITKQRGFKNPKLVQNTQALNNKKILSQQYRALVAQEREQSKQKGMNSFTKNLDELSNDGDNISSFQESLDTDKDEEDEVANIQIDDYQEIEQIFDYDRNKVKVVCNFKTIIDYFETYIKMLNQKIKNIDILPKITQLIEAQVTSINREVQIQVDDLNEQPESQAFKIQNQNQDQSINSLALKPCNEEEIFLWNLANISSSKMELLLQTKNQAAQIKKELSSSQMNNEQNSIRSYYIQTLKTKDLFNDLILQKEQIQGDHLKQISDNTFQKKSTIKNKRKTMFLDKFSQKNLDTEKIDNKLGSISDFDLSDSFKNSVNKTQPISDNDYPLTFQKEGQLSKSHYEKNLIKKRSLTESNVQFLQILNGGKKETIYDKTQNQLEYQKTQKQFDDNFQLEVYNPTYENSRRFSEESFKQEKDHLSKRFVLQNKALNFILLQSKRELPNGQLFQRHLLIKNAIQLMKKSQNSTNFNAFKAMEMVLDYINPQNHFQINKNDSNISINSNRKPSQSIGIQKGSFNNNDKRQSFQFSITSRLDLGSLENINQANQKREAFQKAIQEQEYESSSSSSSGKEQVKDDDSDSDEENKQTEQDQDEILDEQEQEQKVKDRFESTIQKLDNEPEFSARETILGFGERNQTISGSVADRRSSTTLFGQQIQRQQSTFLQSNNRRETEIDFQRNKSQSIQSNYRKGTEMNLGRQQSSVSQFGASDLRQSAQMQQYRQGSEFIQKDKSTVETEINFLEKKNSIQSSKNILKKQTRNTLHLNLNEEDLTEQFQQNIQQNSNKNFKNSVKVVSKYKVNKNNNLLSIQEADEFFEDNSKSQNFNFSSNDLFDSDQKNNNQINFSSKKLNFKQKFNKLFERWGLSGHKNTQRKPSKFTSEKQTNSTFEKLPNQSTKTSQFTNLSPRSTANLSPRSTTKLTPRSTKKLKATDQSFDENNICTNCGFELKQPQASSTSILCPNCKVDIKQTKHFYNYFMKDRPKNDDGIAVRTYLNSNKLFDLPSVAFVKHGTLQVAINEGINNMKSYQMLNEEDKLSKIAQDLVKKAMFISGGGSIHDLCSQQVPIRSITNTKDFPKYNQAQQLTMFGFQMQLAMLVPLPDCLLTYEEYLQIKEPMIINLEYHEIKGKLQKEDGQDIVHKKEQTKYWTQLRNQSLKIQLIIVAMVVILVVMIAIVIAVNLAYFIK